MNYSATLDDSLYSVLKPRTGIKSCKDFINLIKSIVVTGVLKYC